MHELDLARLHAHHPQIKRGINWHLFGHRVRTAIFIICAAAVLFGLFGLLAWIACEILMVVR